MSSARTSVPSTKLEHGTGIKPDTNQYSYGAGAAKLAQDVLLPHTGAGVVDNAGLHTGNAVKASVTPTTGLSSTGLSSGSTFCESSCKTNHAHSFNQGSNLSSTSSVNTTAFQSTPVVRNEGATVIREETQYVKEGSQIIRESPMYVQEAPTVIEKPIIHEKKIVHEKEIIHQQPIIHQKETILREQPILVEKPILMEKHVTVEQPALAESHKTVTDQQRVVQENVVRMSEAPVHIQQPLVKMTDTTQMSSGSSLGSSRLFCSSSCQSGCDLHCQQSCSENCSTHCNSKCDKNCDKHKSNKKGGFFSRK